MDRTTLIGMIAGLFTSFATLPQIAKVIHKKKAQAISPVMFMALLVGNSLWCWYGQLLAAWPIVITNAFAIGCDGLMLFLNYKYTHK